MQNSQINSYNEREISVQEIISLLIKSKKLVISLTLCISVIASVYAFSLKSNFESSISIEIGSFKNEYYMINQDKFDLMFSNISLKKISNTFLLLTVSEALTREQSEAILSEGIDYVLKTSNNEIENGLKKEERWYAAQIDQLESQHENIYDELSVLDSQIDKLSKVDKSLPGSYGIETYLSELVILKSSIISNLKELESKKDSLKEEGLNLKYNPSKVLEDIRINEIKPNRTGFIALSFLSGLILSFLMVFFRLTFSRDTLS
jgi:capsular polysaccharide biosynthesis protein